MRSISIKMEMLGSNTQLGFNSFNRMKSNELLEEIFFVTYGKREFAFVFELIGKPPVRPARRFDVSQLPMELFEVGLYYDDPVVQAARI